MTSLKENLKTLVLYHANCPDGFGAAWAAWRAMGDEAEYRPAFYGTVPDVSGFDRVLLLDISYPRDAMERMAETCGYVQVVDHHKTAAEALDGLPELAGGACGPRVLLGALFDMGHSGAVLSWGYFHGHAPSPSVAVPRLLEYVEDRDLWRWALPHSREISAWLHSHPFDFEAWSGMATDLRLNYVECVAAGATLLRAKDQEVKRQADRATWREIGGHRVPVVNTTVYFSEVGEELCLRHPEAPFAAYYFDRLNDGVRQWGLRSRGGFDCSTVAKAHGGGGHPGASGWEEKL